MRKLKQKRPLSIGIRLRNLREDNNYSQKEIASILLLDIFNIYRLDISLIIIVILSLTASSYNQSVTISFILF